MPNSPSDYLEHIAEHVEPWSYVKFPYLKKVGWKGFVDGKDSGVFRVAPLARLNASDGMATPLAQEEYEKMYTTLGGKPVHHTLAIHWARLIEIVQAAEAMLKLAQDPEITGNNLRNIPTATLTKNRYPGGSQRHSDTSLPDRSIWHHQKANLIVAAVHNSAAVNMSVDKAAKALIKPAKKSRKDSLIVSKWLGVPMTYAWLVLHIIWGIRQCRCMFTIK